MNHIIAIEPMSEQRLAERRKAGTVAVRRFVRETIRQKGSLSLQVVDQSYENWLRRVNSPTPYPEVLAILVGYFGQHACTRLGMRWVQVHWSSESARPLGAVALATDHHLFFVQEVIAEMSQAGVVDLLQATYRFIESRMRAPVFDPAKHARAVARAGSVPIPSNHLEAVSLTHGQLERIKELDEEMVRFLRLYLGAEARCTPESIDAALLLWHRSLDARFEASRLAGMVAAHLGSRAQERFGAEWVEIRTPEGTTIALRFPDEIYTFPFETGRTSLGYRDPRYAQSLWSGYEKIAEDRIPSPVLSFPNS
jgi:hypothetical protein